MQRPCDLAKETIYFETLVRLANASGAEDRDFLIETLRTIKPPIKGTQIANDQYALLTNPHICAIRELAAVHNFESDPEWIAKAFSPRLSVKAVREALELLLRLRLLKKIKTDRSLTMTNLL